MAVFLKENSTSRLSRKAYEWGKSLYCPWRSSHVSQVIRDLPTLLAQVRAGAEVVIEDGAAPIAVLRSPCPGPPRRTISESIALAEERSRRLGYKPVLDADFAADMEEIIRNRKPRVSAWD